MGENYIWVRMKSSKQHGTHSWSGPTGLAGRAAQALEANIAGNARLALDPRIAGRASRACGPRQAASAGGSLHRYLQREKERFPVKRRFRLRLEFAALRKSCDSNPYQVLAEFRPEIGDSCESVAAGAKRQGHNKHVAGVTGHASAAGDTITTGNTLRKN